MSHIDEEFQQIAGERAWITFFRTLKKETSIAPLGLNRGLNRFSDVLPSKYGWMTSMHFSSPRFSNDETRAKLQRGNNDYINANYIEVPSGNRKHILSQVTGEIEKSMVLSVPLEFSTNGLETEQSCHRDVNAADWERIGKSSKCSFASSDWKVIFFFRTKQTFFRHLSTSYFSIRHLSIWHLSFSAFFSCSFLRSKNSCLHYSLGN